MIKISLGGGAVINEINDEIIIHLFHCCDKCNRRSCLIIVKEVATLGAGYVKRGLVYIGLKILLYKCEFFKSSMVQLI